MVDVASMLRCHGQINLAEKIIGKIRNMSSRDRIGTLPTNHEHNRAILGSTIPRANLE
jgi:hypothetical protein